jgi:AGZA family xanthine/uracil permease-like MFS transporter
MSGKYRWAAVGDINAFFGLMLDNVAGLILIVSLLHQNFNFPIDFALQSMIPGTALGVLIGDLAFFFIAFRLAKKTGSDSVTAMPLGLDTPSTFGMVFFVLGPAYQAALTSGVSAGMEPTVEQMHAAAQSAWQIGICSIFVSGLIKIVCSFGSGWVRRVVPRAGLLGSLAAIALVLISFLPLLEILRHPAVGLVALAVILTALVGRVPLPLKLPGAVGGLVVAGTIYALMNGLGMLGPSQPALFDPADALFPTHWTQALSFNWLNAMGETVKYLPVVIPFAIATVVGGIDCTESAAAAGDEYHTNTVIGVEALATLLASLCGAVIQTTPYIGHPAYKAMGGRAAYTLATALTMGLLGISGLFGYFYEFIPKATVYPILVFVGLEIAAQSFLATPRRHYPAVALACVPALATLAVFFVNQLFGDGALLAHGIHPGTLQNSELKANLGTTYLLANGFIVTSILWASALAMVIDRRLMAAAAFYLMAAVCTLFGLMHSPLPNSPILFPWQFPGLPTEIVLPSEHLPSVLAWAQGYAMVAALLALWAGYLRRSGQTQSAFEND